MPSSGNCFRFLAIASRCDCSVPAIRWQAIVHKGWIWGITVLRAPLAKPRTTFKSSTICVHVPGKRVTRVRPGSQVCPRRKPGQPGALRNETFRCVLQVRKTTERNHMCKILQRKLDLQPLLLCGSCFPWVSLTAHDETTSEAAEEAQEGLEGLGLSREASLRCPSRVPPA